MPAFILTSFSAHSADFGKSLLVYCGFLNAITDPNEFMKALQNEWRVEFAFEDHRFWDIRRWQIGEDTQKELYGVNIERATDGTWNFQRTLYKSRTWSQRMYLYPIPQSELFKNKNLNPQNMGW